MSIPNRGGKSKRRRATSLDYMPFLGDDFYGSERVQAMPSPVVAAYHRLLWEQFRSGGAGLPNNLHELERLSGWSSQDDEIMCFLAKKDTQRMFPQIWDEFFLGSFSVDSRSNRLHNSKCSRVRKAAEEKYASAATRGSKGGKRKAQLQLSCSSATAQLPEIVNKKSDESILSSESISSSYARAREEGAQTDVWEKLQDDPWGFRSHPKIQAIVARGTTLEDLEAWEAYAVEHGRGAASSALQRYRHPSEIPEDPAEKAKSERSKPLGARRGKREWV